MSKNKDSITIPKNYLVVGLIIIIAITGGIFIGSKITGKSVADIDQLNNLPDVESNPIYNQQIKSKENCPFECCISDLDYNDKVCNINYECINNKCVAIDSDNDGLTDIEEKEFGSNPSVYDTDSDGLNDYVEKQKGTNPTNMNTDRDRYNDNEDKEPLKTNSAIINFHISEGKEDWNEWNIIKDGAVILATSASLTTCGAATLGACAAATLPVLKILEPILQDVLYTTNGEMVLTNNGDDYSSYVTYDISYSLSGETLNSNLDHKQIGSIPTGGTLSIPYSYDLKVKDIKYALWDLIVNQEKVRIEVKNLDYEKF